MFLCAIVFLFTYKFQNIIQRYSQGKVVFYSVQYKNCCLAASDLFHMFT